MRDRADWDLTARAASAATMVRYRRVLVPVRPGANRVALDRVFPAGMPPGGYRVTVRVACRSGGRLSTSHFLGVEAALRRTPGPGVFAPG